MSPKKILFLFLLPAAIVPLASVHGQSMTAQKTFKYAEGIKKVEAFFKAKKLTVFAAIDHAEAAKAVGLEMPGARVYVFGNPRAGTALMAANPVWALHLPLKAALYQDAKGRVFLSATDVKAIAAKEKLPPAEMETVAAMDALLNELLDIK